MRLYDIVDVEFVNCHVPFEDKPTWLPYGQTLNSEIKYF